MADKFILLKYQESFTDNFSNYAYGKIIEKNSSLKCFYENMPANRTKFESKIKFFNMDLNYICSNRVESIVKKALKQNKDYLDSTEVAKISKRKKNGIINNKKFKIKDIGYLTQDIKNQFNFLNENFIISYDILEDIQQCQSIGLYINKNDFDSNNIDWEFINRATKRLNKYVKKPKLFIFGAKDIKNYIQSDIQYKIIDFLDWKEEFCFLKQCKHKIIISSNNSYSENLWAAILNEYQHGINIYSKIEYSKNLNRNWLAI